MRILFHTMATPELDLIEAAELSAQLGFDGIELICQSGYPCGIDPEASLDEARALGSTLRRLGAPVVVLSPYEKRIADENEVKRQEAVNRLSHAIALAAALGATKFRILAGEEVPDDAWPAALDRLTTSLHHLAAGAQKDGVTLLIENHMDTLAVSAKRTRAICEAVARDNVRILFDPANLATLQAEGFLESFALQHPFIGHVHVKDAVMQAGLRRAVVPCEGQDPWPELFAALRASGYDGDLSIEYERRWQHHLPPAEEALPRAKQFIERHLAEEIRIQV
jgi:sugar phosphate isomerase/epimerase